MGKASEIFFTISLITLLSPILCRSSHHYDKNWISFLPGSTIDESKDNQQIMEKIQEIQDGNSVSASLDSSTPIVMMNDSNNQGGSKGVVVGVPIGGIIFFVLICYCCYRCCCRTKVVNQGTTIINRAPEPASNPTPIIINTVTQAAPPPQTQSPIVIQNVTNAPPQQQQQYPPPYPQTYEMRPPPPQQYYADGGYPNPNASAPPHYGKY